MGYLANSEGPDEMQHFISVCLQCLLRLYSSSGTDIHQLLKKSTCGPLKYTIGSPILIVAIYMRNPLEYKGLNIEKTH